MVMGIEKKIMYFKILLNYKMSIYVNIKFSCPTLPISLSPCCHKQNGPLDNLNIQFMASATWLPYFHFLFKILSHSKPTAYHISVFYSHLKLLESHVSKSNSTPSPLNTCPFSYIYFLRDQNHHPLLSNSPQIANARSLVVTSLIFLPQTLLSLLKFKPSPQLLCY